LFCDGGQQSPQYGIKNLLSPRSTVYSSKTASIVNVLLEHQGKGIPLMTHVMARVPKKDFDSRLRSFAVFAFEELPDLHFLKRFDQMNMMDFYDILRKSEKRMPKKFSSGSNRNGNEKPFISSTDDEHNESGNDYEEDSIDEDSSLVAYVEFSNDQVYCEFSLKFPTVARFVLIKMLSAEKDNFDVEYIGFIGTVVHLEDISRGANGSSSMITEEVSSNSTNTTTTISTVTTTTSTSTSNSDPEKTLLNTFLSVNPSNISDIGNSLGVNRRFKRFTYHHDLDTNGILHWIGTHGGETAWENPLITHKVSVSISHPLYGINMHIEDIIGKSNTSCYWGGSCPQYFILDLRNLRLSCSYFTLRHGYQASNSFMQNWEFSGSHDTVNWSLLYEGGETPFSKAFDVKSWPVPNGKDFFRYFRVLQRGNYSMGKGSTVSGSSYLCISGFELYGEMFSE